MSLQIQAYQTPIATTRSEAYFALLYGTHMRVYPKRFSSKVVKERQKFDPDRQWVFIGRKERMKSVATQSTLFAVLSDPKVETPFFTPNGYYRRDQRLTETLRWLNAYIFDFDTYGDSLQDILDRIDRAGLPSPTAIVKTPSGGYHAAFFFSQPVRASRKAERLYTAIMRHIAEDLGADLHAVGANRVFRTPTDTSLVYFEPANRHAFDDFKAWRDINHPYNPSDEYNNLVRPGDLMSHPALQHLLEQPCGIGSRDVTAFNLALAMKASGWPKEKAQATLSNWFLNCCGQQGQKPFTLRDAVYKADYVYRVDKLRAPRASVIRDLTGLPFYYQTRKHWEKSKTREERVRVHLAEWQSDLLDLLGQNRILTGTQQELATLLGCPLASFKLILRQLRSEGKVVVSVTKGRYGSTSIWLPQQPVNDPNNKIIAFPVDRIQLSKSNHSAIILHFEKVTEQKKVESSPIPKDSEIPP